jgi:hypothetical protein
MLCQLSYTAVVGRSGIEPPTNALSERCSTGLSYRPLFLTQMRGDTRAMLAIFAFIVAVIAAIIAFFGVSGISVIGLLCVAVALLALHLSGVWTYAPWGTRGPRQP